MEIFPAHLRILNALNLEKHLTARQIATLLYPNEEQKKRYFRIVKNLQYLKAKNLLKSKPYGLGKDHFWSLRRHEVITELELEPPKAEVHTYKYAHEKLCADVFVTLYHSGWLHGWGQRRLNSEVIPDRIFYLGDDLYYLEAEKGNQKDAIIQKKVEAYKKYFRQTGEKFQVRFVTDDEKTFKMLSRVLENESYHYQAYTLESLQRAVNLHKNDSNQDSNSEEQELPLSE